MLKEGIIAKDLSAKAFGGGDTFTIANRLDAWLHRRGKKSETTIIHDIIGVPFFDNAGVIVIYSLKEPPAI